MKMRGKMVDGSPVTFEWIDLGGLCYGDMRTGKKSYGPPWITEFVGEGFYVRSAWGGQPVSYGPHNPVGHWRQAFDRQSLERAGVDTATVEQWDPGLWVHDSSGYHRGGWTLFWPTVTRFDKPGIRPDYCGEEMLVGEAMIEAGAARLKDMLVEQAIVRNGEIWFRSPTIVLTKIWQAMMTAKKRGG